MGARLHEFRRVPLSLAMAIGPLDAARDLSLVVWPSDAEVGGLEGASEDDVRLVEVPGAEGFAAALNATLDGAAACDVAVVLAPCELPAAALRRVQAAAYTDDTVGAACALVAGATAMFLGSDGDPVLDVDAEAPRIGGAPVHPRVFSLRGPCIVVRGSTLQLLAPLPRELVQPSQALNELSSRILAVGLSCVVADDVLVRGPGTADAEDRLDGRRAAVRAIDDALEIGPLRRALVAARSSGRARSVTIDGRGLTAGASGTQTYIGGLVTALALSDDLEVRVAVRPGATSETLDRFRDAGVQVDVLGEDDAPAPGRRHTDIAHRPQQVFVAEDLHALRALGERIVISHLDLISYRAPTYHADLAEWLRYRAVTRIALSAADAVAFLSAHAREDAVAEELVEVERTALAGVGMDGPPDDETTRRPAAVPPDVSLLAMIGADYRHKNRVFALRILGELVDTHGWNGVIVLAGGHVPHGSSAAEEAELLTAHPDLARRVIDLGPVDAAHKRWLLAHASALMAPSLYEGFGLVPLEAALAGIPCLYAPVTSMTEVVGADLATIVPWDAAASAARALPLLSAGPPRDAHVAALRASLDRWRWSDVVDRLRGLYDDTLTRPYRPSAPRAFDELQREELIVALERARTDLLARVSHGLPLIDERGGMLSRREQHGLMRITARPWLRGAVLGPIGLLGAIGPELDTGSEPVRGDAAATDEAASP